MRYYNVVNIIEPLMVDAPAMFRKGHVQHVLSRLSEAATRVDPDMTFVNSVRDNPTVFTDTNNLYQHGYNYSVAAFIASFVELIKFMDLYISDANIDSDDAESQIEEFDYIIEESIADEHIDPLLMCMLAIRGLKYPPSNDKIITYRVPKSTGKVTWFLIHEPVPIEQYARTLEEQAIIRIVVSGVEPSNIPRHLIHEIKNNVFLVWTY